MVSSFEFAENVVGIIIDSDVNDKLMAKIQKDIKEKMKCHHTINLFFEIRSGIDVSLPAFIHQMVFNFNIKERFKKIAVVTDLQWLKASMLIKNLLTESEIEIYSTNSRMEALEWISI